MLKKQLLANDRLVLAVLEGLGGMAISDSVRSTLNILKKTDVDHKKHLKRLKKMGYIKSERVILSNTHHLRWELARK